MSDEIRELELEIELLHSRTSALVERIEDLEASHLALENSYRALLGQLIKTAEELIDTIAEGNGDVR